MSNQKHDPRWASWAQGVIEGATLAGRKWSGKNRPFRRLEYEAGLARLEAAGVLTFLERKGYRPRRGRGWDYIRAMARGTVELPPAPPGSTSPGKKSTVRRTHKRAAQKIHTILHKKVEARMKMVMVHQAKNRTIFYLYNDRGERVARLDKRELLTDEQQQEMATKYRQEHPDEFPDEKIEGRDA